MVRIRPLTVLLPAICSLGVAAPAAGASTVDVKRSGQTVTVTGTVTSPASATLDVYAQVSATSNLQVISADLTLTSSDASCSVSGGTATCTPPMGQSLTTLTVDLHNSTSDLTFGLRPNLPTTTNTVQLGGGDDTVQLWTPGTLSAGGGDDQITGSMYADIIDGGPGDDEITGGQGSDQLTGGTGDDWFNALPYDDGADIIDGGADTGDTGGDGVDYADRSQAVTVTMPAESVGTPAGGNGQSGENDQIAHIENAIGGSAGDTLTGNEVSNYLYGKLGADRLYGADGDDYLHARRPDVLSSTPDADLTLSCGAGDDRLRIDREDPAATACEHTSPGAAIPTVQGTPKAGETLTLSALQTYGDVEQVTIEWYDLFGSDSPIGTGPSYTIASSEVGDYIFAVVTLSGADDTFTVATDEVGPVAKGAPAPTPPNPTPVPTPPGPPFSERVAGLVQAALGTTGVVVPAPSLPAGCSLYAASGAATLRYAKAPLKPIAVACDHAVEGALGQWKLTLTPKRKRAKKTTITLAAQPLPFASEGAVPVTLSLSAAQRKKVRSARSVKAVVTVAFPWLRGTFQKASKTFRLKT